MKTVVVNIPNSLMAGGICKYLRQDPGLRVIRHDHREKISGMCIAAKADVLLAEARNYSPYTVSDWLTEYSMVRADRPQCKLAVVVDENSCPETANEVQQACSRGLIDVFFYGTVSGEYVTAVIASL